MINIATVFEGNSRYDLYTAVHIRIHRPQLPAKNNNKQLLAWQWWDFFILSTSNSSIVLVLLGINRNDIKWLGLSLDGFISSLYLHSTRSSQMVSGDIMFLNFSGAALLFKSSIPCWFFAAAVEIPLVVVRRDE
jgi:hypothetical protein